MAIHPPKGAGPYAGTEVSVEKSKLQITKLLREYGAEAVQWSDSFQTGAVQLIFAVRKPDGATVKFVITPAAFRAKHRTWDSIKGRHVEEVLPDWPRSLRLLHAWVKTKLESVAYGLTSVEEEFLAQRIIRDQDGRETTAGAVVLSAIERGGGRLALPSPSPVAPEQGANP